MQQYFINEILDNKNEIELPKDVLHHFKNVLRMRNNEEFYLVDNNSIRYLCVLNDNNALIKERLLDNNDMFVNVTIIQAMIKNDKFDYFLMKSTELGVSNIVPLISQRTIIKLNDKTNNKVERYNKLVFEASCQCKRNSVPKVYNPIKLKEINEYKSDINLVCYEDLNYNSKSILDYVEKGKSITLVIGPEGGFDISEIEYLVDNGFNTVKLGNRILRAETASTYALSVIDSIQE